MIESSLIEVSEHPDYRVSKRVPTILDGIKRFFSQKPDNLSGLCPA